MAGIFEMAGALALGSRVAGTIRDGVANFACFQDEPSLFMIGMMSALASSSLWLIVASYFGLPVSTTHSIVGSIVGMTLSLKGAGCVKWGIGGLSKIFISWLTSPLLAGICAFFIYFAIVRLIFNSATPFNRALAAMPLLFGIATLFLEILILLDILNLPWWGFLALFAGSFVLVVILVQFLAVPWLRKTIEAEILKVPFKDEKINSNEQNKEITTEILNFENNSSEIVDQPLIENLVESETLENSIEPTTQLDLALTPVENNLEEDKAKQIFWWLQNFTACFGAFAHGSNDTANAIGPFAAVFYLWRDGTFNPNESVPIWAVALGGIAIVIGLATLGYKVIQTMGKEITNVNFVNGFSSELSSSMTVVIASRLNIPVSSTHCQVGAIVGVGLVDSDLSGNTKTTFYQRLNQVNWKLFGKIASSWIITLPISGGISALLAYILSFSIID